MGPPTQLLVLTVPFALQTDANAFISVMVQQVLRL